MKFNFKHLFVDFIFLTLLALLSFFLVSRYADANYLLTGYEDWMVHAFRIKSLQIDGFTSWIHTWSNGISIWRGYQFVPHFITLGFSQLFSLDIPRAMVILTILQFVFLRLSIYIILRNLDFKPFTSFICSLLSFDIAQYWGGVSDYSILFGFTLFPWIVFLWIKYIQNKFQFLFPFIAGISVIVHPILMFYSVCLWLITLVMSAKKILRIQTFIQLAIIAISSSLFWAPIVFTHSFRYTNPFLTSLDFTNTVLRPYGYYGLSLFLTASMVILFITLTLPTVKKYPWSVMLTLYSTLFFILIIIGNKISLPPAITMFQFVRGVTFVGMGIIFCLAPTIEKIFSYASHTLRGVALFILTCVFVEGIWFASTFAPQPITSYEEPYTAYIKASEHKLDTKNNRVYLPSVGPSSYFTYPNVLLPYSYAGHAESNLISQRLIQLTQYQPSVDHFSKAYMDVLKNYFQITNTKYIFFDEHSSFSKVLESSTDKNFLDMDSFTAGNLTFHLFEGTWDSYNSFLMHPNNVKHLPLFPNNLSFDKIDDQIKIDELIATFTSTIYDKNNTPLKTSYPTQETIEVEIPKNDSHILFINESYDTDWKGELNGKEVTITPTGPNFMRINLEPFASGILKLKHNTPISFFISLYCVMGLFLLILLYSLFSITRSRRQHA